ncbi:MAG: hypothetical protein HKN75_08655 [Bacteroidia bacterium]|nr:hypothetical protein [Bacteroidia bacterium]
MKNSNNLFASMALFVLFSIVSCQKEDVNDTAFSPQDNASLYQDDIAASARAGDVECLDFEAFSAGTTVGKAFTLPGGKQIIVSGSHESVQGNAARVYESGNAELGKILRVADASSRADGEITFIFSRFQANVKPLSFKAFGVTGANLGSPMVRLYAKQDRLIAEKRFATTGANGISNVDLSSLFYEEAVVKMVIDLNGPGGVDAVCVEEITIVAGCVYSLDYWNSHSGFGQGIPDLVTQHLPILLGQDVNYGSNTVIRNTHQFRTLIKSLDELIAAGNGLALMEQQQLLAKLNIANGSNNTAIKATVDEADRWLNKFESSDWTRISAANKRAASIVTGGLQSLNSGRMSVPACQ